MKTARLTVVIRILVVGAGTIAQSVHLPAIQRMPDTYSLVGVVDLAKDRAEEVASAYGVQPYRDLQEALVALNPDAVLICVPGEQADLVDIAGKHGVHVLAEKPLALTAERSQELHDRFARARLVLWVGYMKMSDPAIHSAVAALSQIGVIRSVEIRVVHPKDERQVRHISLLGTGELKPGEIAALEEAQHRSVTTAIGDASEELRRWYAEVLMGSIVHQFSLFRALGFTANGGVGFVDVWPWPSHDEPPSLLVTGVLSSLTDSTHTSIGEQPRFVLNWTWAPRAPQYQESLEIQGTDGRIHVDLAAPYLIEAQSRLTVTQSDGSFTQHLESTDRPVSSFVNQLEYFAAAIDSNEPIRSTAEGAADDVKVAQQILGFWAARTGSNLAGEASP
jgi:predicted dehydrogenase